MKASSYTTLFFLILLTSASCKKDALPNATQTGANIMAAKVNGTSWKQKSCWSCIGLSVNYDDRSFFGITGDEQERGISITVIIPSLKSTGTYNLASKGGTYARLYNDQEKVIYFTSNTHTGTVTITKLDLTNKIVSGTFEFTAEDEKNPANTIRVTDGRFDVTFL